MRRGYRHHLLSGPWTIGKVCTRCGVSEAWECCRLAIGSRYRLFSQSCVRGRSRWTLSGLGFSQLSAVYSWALARMVTSLPSITPPPVSFWRASPPTRRSAANGEGHVSVRFNHFWPIKIQERKIKLQVKEFQGHRCFDGYLDLFTPKIQHKSPSFLHLSFLITPNATTPAPTLLCCPTPN